MSSAADVPLDTALNQRPVPNERPARRIEANDAAPPDEGLLVVAYDEVLMGNPTDFTKAG